jgi:hypothetical protein
MPYKLAIAARAALPWCSRTSRLPAVASPLARTRTSAQEPHRLLNVRREDCRCGRRIVVLKRHAPIRPRVRPPLNIIEGMPLVRRVRDGTIANDVQNTF